MPEIFKIWTFLLELNHQSTYFENWPAQNTDDSGFLHRLSA